MGRDKEQGHGEEDLRHYLVWGGKNPRRHEKGEQGRLVGRKGVEGREQGRESREWEEG